MYSLFTQDDPTVKPEYGAELDVDYWPGMGGQAALDLPLLGTTKDYARNTSITPTSAPFQGTPYGLSPVFNGTSSQIAASVSWTTNSTFGAWFSTTTILGTDQCLIGNASRWYINIRRTTGVLEFVDAGGTRVSSGINVCDGKLHFACASETVGGTAILYLDGLQVGSHTVSSFSLPTTVYLGSGGGLLFYSGAIHQGFFLGNVLLRFSQVAEINKAPWARFSRRQAVFAPSAAVTGGLLLRRRRMCA